MNINDILFLILQGIAGGTAGYITNKYAVNMLFKEYTPLKLGGVIKKNKDKFIDEISSLVERDIINENTLKNKVIATEFKSQIEDICNSILLNGINLNEIKVKELLNFHESKVNFKNFSEDKLKELLESLIDSFSKNFKIKYMLPKEQISNIADELYRLIINEIIENDDIYKAIVQLYEENKNISISNLISEDSKECIEEKTKRYIRKSVNNILEDKENFYKILDKIFTIVDFESSIDIFCNSLSEMKLSEIINENELNDISKKLYKNISTKEGKNYIANIISMLSESLNESDITIYELLEDNINLDLVKGLDNIIEKIKPYISRYIIDNEKEINCLIEESINESIEGMDGNIKKIILSKAQSILVNNDLSEENLIDKILKFINEYKIDDDAYAEINENIIKYFKNTKVKDFISFLGGKKIIDNIINVDEKKIKLILSAILSKNIGTILNSDLSKFFNEHIKNKLYDFIFRHKNIINIKITETIHDSFKNKIDDFYNINIQSFIENIKNMNLDLFRNLNNKSTDYLITMLKENEVEVKNYMTKELLNSIDRIDLNKEFKDNKDYIEKFTLDKLLILEEDIILKYEDFTLRELIDEFVNREDLNKSLSEKVYNLINNDLEKILNGRIKKSVYDNLSEYNEDEICEIAKDFMGNELKPLSIFGGILGGLVGLIYGGFFSNVNLFGFQRDLFSNIISFLLMGTIGVITNFIAIKMLFYPYNKNKFLAKIPFLNKFSLGYIPAHKGAMANSIGNVMDDKLINGTKISSSLKSKKNILKLDLINNMEENNYNAVINFINTKKENICSSIIDRITKMIEEDVHIYEKISYRICNIKVNKVVKREYLPNLVIKIKKNKIYIEKKLVQYIKNNLNKDRRIKDLISNKTIDKLQESIFTEIRNYIKSNSGELLNEDSLKRIIFSQNKSFNNLINKSLSDLLDESIINSLKEIWINKIEDFIIRDLKPILSTELNEYLDKEFNSNNKTVGTMFNGAIVSLINSNLDLIKSSLARYALIYLENKEEDISKEVKNLITSKLNFLEKGIFFMANGNSLIDKCINIMITNKIPVFVNSKIEESTYLLEECLENDMYNLNSSEFNINNFDTIKILDKVSYSLKKKEEMFKEIHSCMDHFFNIFINIKLVNILKLINLDNLNNVYKKFSDQINLLSNDFSDNLTKHNEEISKYIYEVFKENISDSIKETRVTEIIDKFNEKHIKNTLDIILDYILNSKSLESNFNDLISKFYNVRLDCSIKNFVNEDMLSEDIKISLKDLMNKEEFQNVLKNSINNIIDDMLENNAQFINLDTKKDIVEKVLDDILSISIEHTSEILKVLHLKEVTKKEIINMDSKEIHNLVDSFAGMYFKKLYLYGSFGAIFGANLYFSIIWAIGEYINSKVK